MVVSETGAQASCAKKPVQAGLRGSAALVAASWILAGCSTFSINPANWWHRQEGGKIAEQRPTPPGADQPYPNISTVPGKPDAPDAEALKKLTDSLVADRTNAQHAAQAAPLADPSSPSASPGLFGVGTAPPPPPPSGAAKANAGTPAASASMPAVTAPPPPAPAPAPRSLVQSTPLPAPAAASGPTEFPPEAKPPEAKAEPAAAPPALPQAQPALPAAPPPRPGAAGPPPAPVAAAEPAPAPSAPGAATIVFLEGAANLSQPATDEVKAFAAKRGNAPIGVTGYGDAVSSDPSAQSVALDLGLSRAQSIVEALKAAGVPGNAIRISAEASGRGASLRLLQ
jgi:outer membrane protein OmpA-like peptidoglycan-associated protein